MTLTMKPGSEDYRAPEGETTRYDEKIDVWALAATMKVLVSAAPSNIHPRFSQDDVDEELVKCSRRGKWSKGFLKLMANMYTVTPEKRHALARIKRDKWFLWGVEGPQQG